MKWLVLVPTMLERKRLRIPQRDQIQLETCGFGPVVAAASTSRWIARYQPDRILMCGIAGRLSPSVSIGSAYHFTRVALAGIGVGHGIAHLSAEQLGWKQWEQEGAEVASTWTLDLAANADPARQCDLLVSCCAASASASDAAIVKERYPLAIAEDMESFAVACAATLASRPCHVIRGISNDAGDRNHSRWKIDDALKQVSKLVTDLVERI